MRRLLNGSGRFILALLTFSLPACSYDHSKYADPDDGSENVVYQFIDAETMKPIQGAYVNAVWVKPTPAGKVGSPGCVRAALLRSDANGWVRMKGPKGAVLDRDSFMVPEYEFFQYAYQAPDNNHVTHYVRGDPTMTKFFPAWVKNLEQLGYVYGQSVERNVYIKSFPIAGFIDNVSDIKYPQRYFIKYRSFPFDTTYGLANISYSCGPEGENIGLSEAEVAETGTRRGLLQAEILCDEKWDTATAMPEYSIAKALWMVLPQSRAAEAWSQFKLAVPTYNGTYEGGKAFTRNERLQFCSWIKPYIEKYQ
jgi:hypothetical protein